MKMAGSQPLLSNLALALQLNAIEKQSLVTLDAAKPWLIVNFSHFMFCFFTPPIESTAVSGTDDVGAKASRTGRARRRPTGKYSRAGFANTSSVPGAARKVGTVLFGLLICKFASIPLSERKEANGRVNIETMPIVSNLFAYSRQQ